MSECNHSTDRNNLTYPVLRVSPPFGEAFRPPRAVANDGDDDSSRAAYHTYRASNDRVMTVWVDWGDGSLFTTTTTKVDAKTTARACMATLTIRGLGRRPAYHLVRKKQVENIGLSQELPDMSVSWPAQGNSSSCCISPAYPEYLATLQISIPHDNSNNTNATIDTNYSSRLLLERNLHVLPPPMDPFLYQLEDILWFPEMRTKSPSRPSSQNGVRDGAATSKIKVPASISKHPRRRGFGLELETVQLPPDEDHLSHPRTLQTMIETARAHDTTATFNNNTQLWDRLLLWKVEQDLQVENATPFARLDLWKKLHASSSTTEPLDPLVPLILGGRQELLTQDLPNEGIDPSQLQNLSSPEYKSPPPPHELYYDFSSTNDGDDNDEDDDRNAQAEIYVFIDRILKSGTRPILCPTISDIGMSASSIHVHVNICHPQAWPHHHGHDNNEIQLTRSTLNVVLQWIRFDGVIRQFCQPWMWRDRDLMSLHATGPECLYPEVAWKQGTTISSETLEYWNVAGFMEHIYAAYNNLLGERPQMTSSESDDDSDCWSDDANGENDETGGSFLFGRADPNHDRKDNKNERAEDASPWSQEKLPFFASVFNDEIIRKTLGRKCSLNLLSLKKYGTVEMRRMHATLDADFVAAWTRFCVGFVEHFSSDMPASSDENLLLDLVKVCLEEALDASHGLAQLIQSQNQATMEDLIEILTEGECPAVPALIFGTLLKHAN